ncbi:kinase-like protein [Sodiomyces alkalinus F11]|uniref:non-specific serine/threonine protein kinase n=1 Tax=Sodiomyces alkalinus (strain CBS 110278 / VKM F-3762 / F11) TaxID=1314773 RepID=A0A3N2PSN7_SODAK|nr:kinase-like protein [Sodiomyces alkalinus F11]ROT37434.1 kinase-like protein [Sodiomyces alkalinus F11]
MNVDQSSRPAAADDDGADQIGFETPRSGVATPKPDLHDRRLPGIMSYFGQVRTHSVLGRSSSTMTVRDMSQKRRGELERGVSEDVARASASAVSKPKMTSLEPLSPLSPHHDDFRGSSPVAAPSSLTLFHGYPTPPMSRCSSVGRLTRSLSRWSGGDRGDATAHSPSRSLSRQASTPDALLKTYSPMVSCLSSVVTASAVHAAHLSNPSVSSQHATPPSSAHTPASSKPVVSSVETSSSLDALRKLTQVAVVKSGPPTPTRALSSAQPSQSEDKLGSKRSSNETGTSSPTQTPQASGGAQVPAAKGKLTIKIVEARGLRKARDPYVIAVFQRSELISAGSRSVQEDDDEATAPPSLGAIPIQRQGSDSGRPPVSIPMRSRQSSNTSLADYNNFRNRPKRSFTSPTWDAEAAFDVVDSDMLVDVSVYDHSPSGETFLGHVNFNASMDAPVRGWYPLTGHADTMAENAPTGEIYVEAAYQRTDRKHFGPEDFQILRLIGKGTFGQVYQVRKKDTGRIYAMKVLSKKVIVQKKEVAHTVGERNILVRTAMTESPFIVGLKFSFQTPSDLYLVTDYMSGGELFWHLQKEGRFDEKRAKFYIAELILAIEHLHKNDIVYRDLKPENILLDANGHIALCDFGLSKANLTKNDTTNTFCGTTEYLAPEVLLDESGYTKMVDFWSLGVLVFEMCCGWSPFYAEDTQQMYKNIAFGKVRFPRDTLSQEGRNFVKGLLNRNPKHRLGATLDAEELKQHLFFEDIDWVTLSKKLITPPFKPKLSSATDVSYFDPEFTNALDNNGSLNERAAALAKGLTTSTPLSPSVQANFQGFTFVDESALDDHMRDRRRYDDEDMHDAHGHRRDDDDWDDLGDVAPRRGNRMSGIEGTNDNDSSDTHDDPMIGNSHFDD